MEVLFFSGMVDMDGIISAEVIRVNAKMEKLFVEQFIRRERRERLLHELNNPKKRRTGICRFCHRADEMLDMHRVIYRGDGLYDEELGKLMLGSGCAGECYIMAYNEYLDGRTLPWREAWREVNGNGMPAVMVFDGFAVVETEQVQGAAEKFVLAL